MRLPVVDFDDGIDNHIESFNSFARHIEINFLRNWSLSLKMNIQPIIGRSGPSNKTAQKSQICAQLQGNT